MTRWFRNIAISLGLLLGAFGVSASAQDAAEMLLRLDRLESENRRLNGQVEEMSFQLRRLEDQLKRAQADADLRFRDLEQGRGGQPRTATPAPVTQTPTPGRRQDAFDPATSPARPVRPARSDRAVAAATSTRRSMLRAIRVRRWLHCRKPAHPAIRAWISKQPARSSSRAAMPRPRVRSGSSCGRIHEIGV